MPALSFSLSRLNPTTYLRHARKRVLCKKRADLHGIDIDIANGKYKKNKIFVLLEIILFAMLTNIKIEKCTAPLHMFADFVLRTNFNQIFKNNSTLRRRIRRKKTVRGFI